MATAKKAASGSGTPRASTTKARSKSASKSTSAKAAGGAKKSAAAKKATAKKATASKATATKASAKGAAKKTPAKKSAAASTTSGKTTGRKYSPAASKSVEREMRAMHEGKLTIGKSKKKVTNPKQAIAIGLAEARRAGAKVPPNPNESAT